MKDLRLSRGLNQVELAKELGMKVLKYDEHHDVFYYPQTKTIFELHKVLFVGRLQKYFGVGFEKAHLKEGTKARYELNREDFYISILAHSAYHFAEDAGVGIRHLTDVYLYKNAYKLDYEYLDRELQKCGLKKFKDKFELMADYLFDDAIIDEETTTLVEHVIASSVLANKKMQGASEVASNMENGENSAKRKTLIKTLFPPPSHMQYTYPVLKKAKWLMPFFYLVRWIHVLFTRPKNIKKIKGISEVDKETLNQMKKIRSTLGLDEF
jgi:transcriptional regulator with XRE-family HTH domain